MGGEVGQGFVELAHAGLPDLLGGLAPALAAAVHVTSSTLRRVTFRILHVFEFRDDLISRENVWLDGAAIAQQLT